jgi:mono/diheme cytochrome c family protein
LRWNTLSQEYTNKSSERFVKFVFTFTNISPSEVLIHSANSSCFCTVAKLPEKPWRIPAGSNGPIEVTMDLAGKMGRVTKGVFVDSSGGQYNLIVSTVVTPLDPAAVTQAPPGMKDADRLQNMQAALADRQAIFKRSECASCHAQPAQGKTDGASLYAGVCANCHDSPHRASIVPDLRALNHPTDLDHWTRWITYGRAGSMMAAFGQAEGGPLTESQIAAIAQYLVRTIPARPGAGAGQAPSEVAPVTPGGGSGSAAPLRRPASR